MARPTPKLYNALVEAFTKVGKPEYAKVARLAATSSYVAKRAWEAGWPQRDELDMEMPAIREVLYGEVLAARAARATATRRLMAKHAQMLQDAQDDSAQQRAIEGMAVRSIMVAVDALARETVQFTKLLPKLQAKITELLNRAIDDPDFSLQQLQQVITWATVNLDTLSKAADKAQALERKFMGEADTTIKVVDGRSPEEKAGSLLKTLLALKEANRLPSPAAPEKVLAAVPSSDSLQEALPVIDAEFIVKMS